jgi:hypothetical protein
LSEGLRSEGLRYAEGQIDRLLALAAVGRPAAPHRHLSARSGPEIEISSTPQRLLPGKRTSGLSGEPYGSAPTRSIGLPAVKRIARR